MHDGAGRHSRRARGLLLRGRSAGERFVGYFHDGLEPAPTEASPLLPPDELGCPSDDIFESNDVDAEAVSLGNGAGLSGILCSGADVYALTVEQSCDVRVELSLRHARGNLDLCVTAPSGTRVCSRSTADFESVSFAAADAGRFVIEVEGASGGTGPYDLSAQAFNCN